MMTKIEKLLLSPQNIFTVQDLALLWEIADQKKLWSIIRYYLRIKRLLRIHKGLYSIRPYTSFEVAQKLITPSYVSFYSALSACGIIFQHYEMVYSMALISKEITIKSETYKYHQLKQQVFFDPLGIEDKNTYKIAGPERAMCDSLYLVPGLAFDNLRGVNVDLLSTIAQIYDNARLEKEVAKIIHVEAHRD